MGFPFNIYATAEASNFKLGTQLGFAKVHQKFHSEENRGWSWAREAPQNMGLPLNVSATAKASDFKFGTQLGVAKAHHIICLLYTSDAADE